MEVNLDASLLAYTAGPEINWLQWSSTSAWQGCHCILKQAPNLCARTHHACHDVAVTCFDSWIAVQFCKKVCWHFNGWHLQYFRLAVSSIEKTFGLVHCKRCVSLPPLEVWVMGQTSFSYLMKRRHRFSSPSGGYLGTGWGCQKPCLEWSTILHQAVKSHQHPLFPLGVSSLEIFNF